MSIELGNRLFDGPHPIKEWSPLSFPAIYAVLMKPDPKNQRDVYDILYLCESSEFSEIESGLGHPKYECWFKEAGFKGNIYISGHVMPNSSFEERQLLKNWLVSLYGPVCNDNDSNTQNG